MQKKLNRNIVFDSLKISGCLATNIQYMIGGPHAIPTPQNLIQLPPNKGK